MDLDEYEYDDTQPPSRTGSIVEDDELLDWIGYHGLQRMRLFGEGATFNPIDKAWLVTVTGAQYLHHDRHVDNIEDISAHTWNLIAHVDGDQMLLCENGHLQFEHFEFIRGQMIYLNTTNLHMVSRKDPSSTMIMMQVSHLGPDDEQEAIAYIKKVHADYMEGKVHFNNKEKTA